MRREWNFREFLLLTKCFRREGRVEFFENNSKIGIMKGVMNSKWEIDEVRCSAFYNVKSLVLMSFARKSLIFGRNTYNTEV